MRVLPIGIEPFPGETVTSVYRRLAEANRLPTGELWTAIRGTQPGLPLETKPALVPRQVEELAGLPRHYLDGHAHGRLFVRCAHADWRYTGCSTCAPSPTPVSMCIRCSRGEPVDVRIRCGAVCARHRRWHYAGADQDLTGQEAHLRAERCLVGTLWQRGVGLDTGELELATELMVLRRAVDNRGALSPTYSERLRVLYPEPYD